MDTYDIERDTSHDLTNDQLWSRILINALEDEMYDGIGAAPPCGTFCANRSIGDGPAQLRGGTVPGIYGFK